MDGSTFKLPLPIRVANALADRAAFSPVNWFHPENILRAVDQGTGGANLLPARVTDALEILCRSCVDDANLHLWGCFRLWSLIKDTLEMRVRLEQTFRERPELSHQPLVPPLVVTGLFRSGTTFLHRMLAAADDARSLALWELLAPFSRPGAIVPPRIDASMKFNWMRRTASPELDAMHYARPDLPEECVVALRLDLRSYLLWRSAPVFSYHRFLLEEELDDTYRMYRRLLQYFQSSTFGRRLTLKAPMHLLGLGALLEVFPEAMVVQTHRDPVECVPSDHKLLLGFHASVTRGVDRNRLIETNTRGQCAMAERSVAVRDTEGGKRIYDVDYRELVRDPVGVVRGIYGHFGLPFSARYEEQLGAFVGENRQYKHGANRYSSEQFGQTRDELARRFVAYRERFGVT